MLRTYWLIYLFIAVSAANSVYYTSCTQSATRTCIYGTNITYRLLDLKKGGSNVLSTNNYDINFFPCQEYNYNCGYQEYSTQFLTLANGVQLNTTYSELLNWVPSDSTLTNMVKPYLNLQGAKAKCVSNIFPLILTDTQSNQILVGYLNRLATNLSTIYNTNKFTASLVWSNLNINIKTAILQLAKYNMSSNFFATKFWTGFLFNTFITLSNDLKSQYTSKNCPECLHSSYLIDSVTSICNKYQSINFLIDESSIIGSASFSSALSFLTSYVSQTNDDLTMMSINFYDSSFESWIGFNNTKANILSRISSKTYRGIGSPATGTAINASIAQINAANFANGIPKILVVVTAANSTNDVIQAANYARSFGIIVFGVAVGSSVNNTQLLSMTTTQSNIINVATYSILPQLAGLISNYFCKQMLNVDLNSTLYNNYVRSSSSPSYFRIPKSSNPLQYYQLTISYSSDPILNPVTVLQSHYDPFPDNFSNYTKSQSYRTSILNYSYFIPPSSNQEIPVKKTVTLTSSPSYSYFSFSGTNINFTIGLTSCTTLNCTQQRSVASSIGKSNSINLLNDDPSASNIDPSIFVAVGFSLAGLALATFGSVYSLKKLVEPPEEITDQLHPQNQEIGNEDIIRNDYISQNQENPSQQNLSNRKSLRKGSQPQNKHNSQQSNRSYSQRQEKHSNKSVKLQKQNNQPRKSNNNSLQRQNQSPVQKSNKPSPDKTKELIHQQNHIAAPSKSNKIANFRQN